MACIQPVIFDGHNDVLCKLYRAGGVTAARSFIEGRDGAIDQPKARQGGFGGGFFAVYVPSPTDLDDKYDEMTKPSYDLPLPDPIALENAQAVALSQAATLLELERLGGLVICRTVAEIRAAFDAGRIAAIFHIEGPRRLTPICTCSTCSTRRGCAPSGRSGAAIRSLVTGCRFASRPRRISGRG